MTGNAREHLANGNVDVLVVTALKMEFDAARDAALAKHPEDTGVSLWHEESNNAATPYLVGDYRGNGVVPIRLALARPTRMGGTSTGPVVASLVERLRPHCLAMCGVCAGNPKEVALGDVIVAEMAYAYDEGKRNVGSLDADHRQISMSDIWIRAAQELTPDGLPSFGLASDKDVELWLLERLYNGDNPRKHPARDRYVAKGKWKSRLHALERKGLVLRSGSNIEITADGRDLVESSLAYNVDPPEHLPFAIKVGPMASGNVVVKDGLTWDQLKNWGVRTILGLEMEAATVASVAFRLGLPQWVVVKGVMDHADVAKDDRYKPFAARASAEVLFRYLCMQLSARRPAPVELPAVGADSRGEPGRFGSLNDSTFETIARALRREAPRYESVLARARDAALRAFVEAEKATLLAGKVRQQLGPKTLKARERLQEHKVQTLKIPGKQARQLSSLDVGGKIWETGDEYFGELVDGVEYGLGEYKIYQVNRELTPTNVARYAGAVENGEFGRYGVYTFAGGTRFAGEWLDNRPRLGYEEMMGPEFTYECYFGFLAAVASESGPRWIPHGEGVAVRVGHFELECGEFRSGKLFRAACDEPLKYDT